MKLKLLLTIPLLVGATFAQAQQHPPQNVPKPTVADAQRVVQIISSNKTKTQQYCDMGKLNEQMMQAEQKRDTATLDRLGKQADELAEKIGPEYVRLMDGLDQVDENSEQGKAIHAALAKLDAACGKQ